LRIGVAQTMRVLISNNVGALYRAKHAGRNRVFIAEPEPAEALPAAITTPTPSPVMDDADGWPDPSDFAATPATATPQPLLRSRA
jgi:hypothetical protein